MSGIMDEITVESTVEQPKQKKKVYKGENRSTKHK